MNHLLKRTINTGILSLILAIAGVILSKLYPGSVDRESLAVMLVSMFVIAVSVFSLIYAAEKRPPDSQAVFSLAAIGLKFILSAILAIVYFKGFKKYGMNNIVLFFVLYLTFAVYTVTVVVNTLKIRSLKNDQN
ncbi:MAG: hypothetical protein V2I37_11295 [Marinilabiliaceae bacterium]|jgi:hypothetical protein|nr:hypothetical protein [Marinilabiliaceae bacterium]